MYTTYCMQVLCADGFPRRKMMRVVRMICDVHEKVNLSIPFFLFFHACSIYTHGSLSLYSSLSRIHSESFLSPAPVMLSHLLFLPSSLFHSYGLDLLEFIS